jgi:hypothetical protein
MFIQIGNRQTKMAATCNALSNEVLSLQDEMQTPGIEYSKLPQKKDSLKNTAQYFQHAHVNNFHKP